MAMPTCKAACTNSYPKHVAKRLERVDPQRKQNRVPIATSNYGANSNYRTAVRTAKKAKKPKACSLEVLHTCLMWAAVMRELPGARVMSRPGISGLEGS